MTTAKPALTNDELVATRYALSDAGDAFNEIKGNLDKIHNILNADWNAVMRYPDQLGADGYRLVNLASPLEADLVARQLESIADAVAKLAAFIA